MRTLTLYWTSALVPAGNTSTLLCAGQPSFDAGSQLPDATNSKTLAVGRALILADPVDVQVLLASLAPGTKRLCWCF